MVVNGGEIRGECVWFRFGELAQVGMNGGMMIRGPTTYVLVGNGHVCWGKADKVGVE